MKGIKMRTLPAEVQVATWEAMGALPTSIDASELYTALQQGTVRCINANWWMRLTLY